MEGTASPRRDKRPAKPGPLGRSLADRGEWASGFWGLSSLAWQKETYKQGPFRAEVLLDQRTEYLLRGGKYVGGSFSG